MLEEMSKRTQSEDISLMACLLNPFTKGLDLVPEEKEKAHALLSGLVCGITIVKRVKNTPEALEGNVPPLPALPNMPNLNLPEADDGTDHEVQPDFSQPSPAKKT
jgi:hypothetical protein